MLKRSSLVVAFAAGLSGSASAFCIFNCPPDEKAGRAVLVGVIKRGAPDVKFELVEFRKTNGREMQVAGQRIYVMEVAGTFYYPEGLYARCIAHVQGAGFDQFCFQKQLEGFTFFPKGGKETFASKELQFIKTERGWKGPDGQLY